MADTKTHFTKKKKRGLGIYQQNILTKRVSVPYNVVGSNIAENIQKKLTESIENFKRPESKKEVMRYLGMVNFYRNFIPKCAETCEPLHHLTKDNTPFNWTTE